MLVLLSWQKNGILNVNIKFLYSYLCWISICILCILQFRFYFMDSYVKWREKHNGTIFGAFLWISKVELLYLSRVMALKFKILIFGDNLLYPFYIPILWSLDGFICKMTRRTQWYHFLRVLINISWCFWAFTPFSLIKVVYWWFRVDILTAYISNTSHIVCFFVTNITQVFCNVFR